MKTKPTYEELEEKIKKFKIEAAKYKHTEEKIERINLVLRTIRKVNHLITTVKDRDVLLQGACDNLIENRGYYNTWLALLDDSCGLIKTYESGLGKKFLPMDNHLRCGKLTDCANRALKQSNVVITKDPFSNCKDCPLSGMYGNGRGAMTAPLIHRGKIYGLFSASIPLYLATENEERSLFKEVADDIAFALYTIELDEDRKHAEAELRKHHDNLEELVDERTQQLKHTNELLMHEASERNQIAMTLNESKQELSSIIESVPDIIYRIDADGYITFISNSVKQYGYDPKTLMGKYLLDLVHPEDQKEANYKIKERRTGKRSTKLSEVRLLAANQNMTPYKYFSISSEGLYGSEKTEKDYFRGTQGIARDITDKKNAQTEQLNREKLQGVLEMAGAVCHELNQPLQSLSGYSELLLMDIDNIRDKQLYERINKIKQQTERMGEITKKLMGITKYKTKVYLTEKIIDIS